MTFGGSLLINSPASVNDFFETDIFLGLDRTAH
jgi:hypothetical protein